MWVGASDQRKRAISTAVAHFLHTEGVTGSNPVSPINFIRPEIVSSNYNVGTSIFSICLALCGIQVKMAGNN
jgi:hypothetical protein